MPRRILLLITDLEIGGTPTVVRELAIRLNDPPNVAVEVACLKGWGPVAAELAVAGIAVDTLDAGRPTGLPLVVGRLVGLVRRSRIDTVFSFLLHANAVAAAARVCCPHVRFLQSVQTTQPRPAWHWRVQGMVHRAADRVVVPSTSVAQAAMERSGVPRGKLAVIPNAVDAATFARPPDMPPAWIGKVGFIGRLDPVKRIPDLLAAMTLLPGYSLDIFGDGAERKSLLDEMERLRLLHRVTLSGAFSPPQSILWNLSTLVLPSEAEGFGLVLIEAMAAGVPVIASDVPGCRDVVRHEVNGLLVPVASPREIAKAIARLRADDSLRRRLIAGGLADVAARFSWTSILPQYRQLLGLDVQS